MRLATNPGTNTLEVIESTLAQLFSGKSLSTPSSAPCINTHESCKHDWNSGSHCNNPSGRGNNSSRCGTNISCRRSLSVETTSPVATVSPVATPSPVAAASSVATSPVTVAYLVATSLIASACQVATTPVVAALHVEMAAKVSIKERKATIVPLSKRLETYHHELAFLFCRLKKSYLLCAVRDYLVLQTLFCYSDISHMHII